MHWLGNDGKERKRGEWMNWKVSGRTDLQKENVWMVACVSVLLEAMYE
jgi:hypothetical protein